MGMFGQSGRRKSQALGFYQALTGAADAGAIGLEHMASDLGAPVDRINATFGGMSAQEAAAMHRAYIARMRLQGVEPGRLGLFLGQVLGGPAAALAAPPPRQISPPRRSGDPNR